MPLNSSHLPIANAFLEGRLVPFLGAGVNLCSRPRKWKPYETLPSGGELAAHLCQFIEGEPPGDLTRVCQHIATMEGDGPLYERLRPLFDVDFKPSLPHQFLASVPGLIRRKKYPRTTDPLRRQFVMVTTNYDDVLERAFAAARQPFHLVSYIAKGPNRGKFLHQPPKGRPEVIPIPNECKTIQVSLHPVILKIHGAVDRSASDGDSFVITEDDYIDYLTRADLATLLPAPLPAILQRSSFLFLGYGLRDWNLRVILHRLWGDRQLNYESWAVMPNPNQLDVRFWTLRRVTVLDERLEKFIPALKAKLEAAAPAKVGR
jgi:hypothetical protein